MFQRLSLINCPSSDPIEAHADYEPPLEDDSDAISLQSELESTAGSETGAEDSPTCEKSEQENMDSEDDELTLDNMAGSDKELDAKEFTPDTQREDVTPGHPVSGLLVLIANMETTIIHMTRSASARLDLFTAEPPKIVSIEEDRKKTPIKMLNEIRRLRETVNSNIPGARTCSWSAQCCKCTLHINSP